MNNQLRKTILGLLGLAAFFGATFLPRVFGQQQPQETYRTVRRLPVEENEPLTITMIAVKGESIPANQKFLGSDDWLNGLKITLKNSSDKAILYASVQLQFPIPDRSSKVSIAVHDLFYGNHALLAQPTITDAKADVLAPGQSIDVKLSGSDVDAISRLLALNGDKGSIEEVAIRISRTIFVDDTMWYAGTYLKRDPNDPGNWARLSK